MDLKISYSSKGIENEDVEGLMVFFQKNQIPVLQDCLICPKT